MQIGGMGYKMRHYDKVLELIEKVSASKIDSLFIEDGDFKVEISKNANNTISTTPIIQNTQAQAIPQVVAEQKEQAQSFKGAAVTSPIVGTFYEAPSPDKPAFVSVGSIVKKGDVLFIIESMKLMNEVNSDLDGVVTEIFVKNAQAVEFGQPILSIELSK